MKAKSKNKKNYGGSIALFVIGSVAGILGYFLLQSGFISESSLATFTGTITSKGEYEETSLPVRDPETGTRQRTVQKFYFIKLAGLNQRLTTYNSDEKYWELDKVLNVGDQITATYFPSDNSEVDVYEIKKGEKLILDSSGKRLRYKIGGFVLLIGALLIFAYAARIWGK